jgi:hypothetical protein
MYLDESIFAQGPKIFSSGHTQIEQNIFHIFSSNFSSPNVLCRDSCCLAGHDAPANA